MVARATRSHPRARSGAYVAIDSPGHVSSSAARWPAVVFSVRVYTVRKWVRVFAFAGILASTPGALALVGTNLIANGDFEAGLSGWSRGSGPHLVASGCGSGNALRIDNDPSWNGGAWQALPAADGPAWTARLSARVTGGAANPSANLFEVLYNWDPHSGAADLVTYVAFFDGRVHFQAGNPAAGSIAASAPVDGACHDYEARLLPLAGRGVLAIDGVPVLASEGDFSGFMGAGLSVFVGDASGCDCFGGPAPNVDYDDLFFGAGL